MLEERRAATLHLLEEECRALEAFCDENSGTGERSDEDDLFFQLPQASPSSAEVQQWVNDRETDLSVLQKFPKIKKIFI